MGSAADERLNKLLKGIPGIKAAAIVSVEGLPIALALPSDVDNTRIAAMTATLFSLSKKAITEMQRGDFDQLYIKGSDSYILILQAGLNAILIVLADNDIRLGLIGIFDDDDFFPFPYIFKPPGPPGDLGAESQSQIKIPIKKKPESKIYCQYCGMELTKDEQFSHNCRKKPK
ncbi:MAG: roadblock/LC7 domain-containing protein [Promethearchaeota archaeon]